MLQLLLLLLWWWWWWWYTNQHCMLQAIAIVMAPTDKKLPYVS